MSNEVLTPEVVKGTVEEVKKEPETPKMHIVYVHNDATTPFQFVTSVLMEVCRLQAQKAQDVMIEAHRKGLARVGAYSKDVAETMVTNAIGVSRASGWDLMFSSEPES